MKIFVKTLKDTHFEIEVKPENTVADVKKNIETLQGSNKCPAAKQMLFYQGNVMKDDTTLQENKVAENSFIVIMLTKTKGSPGEGSSISAAPTTNVPISTPLAAPSPLPASVSPAPVPAPAPSPSAVVSPNESSTVAYGEGVSNLVSATNFDQLVQQILDMGGGTWDRDTAVRALRAAHNMPERAVLYMYILGAGLNTERTGALDFLRLSPQFQGLRAIVQANPQMLQPMLQELGKQNPHVVRLIQENQDDFHRLINEPIEGRECNNIRGQPVTVVPQAIQVTPTERDAIERLEVMGFDRATVLEVYFACNKNEELAANYLLDHLHELED